VVVLLILLFMRSLRRRFGEIGGSMQRLAAGDLTVQLNQASRDEVADLAKQVQSYIDEFARVVGDIKGIAESAGALRSDLVAASEESSASVTQIGGNISSIGSTIEDLDKTIEQTGSKLEEINGSIRELEERIEHQTRSVQESSSAVEEMTASVNNVSRIAADRQDAAKKLKAVTDEGHANIEATDEKVSSIADSVDEILGIITVINTIASQTSILSMNAAIEAAHAGEYGRGFSVVAAEIRRLSESTNENAKRIKEQLQTVAELATDTKRMSETTRERFSAVEHEVDSTAAALTEISATMRELADGTEAVLTATGQAGQVTQSIRSDATIVASRSDDITRDMHHIREISTSVRGGIQEIGVGTQEINQMVSNLASVTRDMTDQIDLLGHSVSRFTTEADGDGRSADAAGDPEGDVGAEEDVGLEGGSIAGSVATTGSVATVGPADPQVDAEPEDARREPASEDAEGGAGPNGDETSDERGQPVGASGE
jgi:methyl-accepting chemotaxis protein